MKRDLDIVFMHLLIISIVFLLQESQGFSDSGFPPWDFWASASSHFLRRTPTVSRSTPRSSAMTLTSQRTLNLPPRRAAASPTLMILEPSSPRDSSPLLLTSLVPLITPLRNGSGTECTWSSPPLPCAWDPPLHIRACVACEEPPPSRTWKGSAPTRRAPSETGMPAKVARDTPCPHSLLEHQISLFP